MSRKSKGRKAAKKAAAANKAAAQQPRSARRGAQQQGKKKKRAHPASSYINWALGKHHLPPTRIPYPVPDGARVVHYKTVRQRLLITPSAGEKECGFVLSKDSAHTDYFNGTGLSVCNAYKWVTMTAGNTPALVPLTLDAQYVTGTADNGSGYSRFFGGTFAWRSRDTKLNTGGAAYIMGGRDLALVFTPTGLTADLQGPTNTAMSSITCSNEQPITQSWRGVRVVPTAPDQRRFRDIPETIFSGNIGEYMPSAAFEFADRGLCDGIYFVTAAEASPIEVMVELTYQIVRYNPNSATPVLTDGQPTVNVPSAPGISSMIENVVNSISSMTQAGGMPGFNIGDVLAGAGGLWAGSSIGTGGIMDSIGSMIGGALGDLGVGSLVDALPLMLL